MTREDAQKILQMFRVSYPHSYKDMTKQDASMFVNLWSKGLENIPSAVVFKAVKDIIYNDAREFAPNIAQVRTRVMQNLAPETEERSIHAWEQLTKFIRNTSTWNTKEEELPMYNKLDEVTKQIYTYREAKDLAQLSRDTLERRRNEFLRLYKTITNKRNEQLLNEGNLIELADGTDRLLSLGYTQSEVMELQLPKPTYETKGIIGNVKKD